MLSFVQSWFSESANPIGVDFGTEWLRLAQVEIVRNDCNLIAAAAAPVPTEIRNDFEARLTFFSASLRKLLSTGDFRGRNAALALPGVDLHIQHLRLPKMDEASLEKSLQWETRGKLPIDPSAAVIRHLVAGDIYHELEPRSEVIVFAAERQRVERLIVAASSARLEIVGMNIEPQVLIDCFSAIFHRKSDSESTSCFIDIGSTTSRIVIARAGQIYFARKLPVGGIDLVTSPPSTGEREPELCALALDRLIEELERCRRYHEAAFPDRPVDRLVFFGGAAGNRDLCQQIARGMQLPAMIGDPMVRMRRTTQVGIESGVDRRLPQPQWAVAIGLSLSGVGSVAK